jgi:hypothetical protein
MFESKKLKFLLLIRSKEMPSCVGNIPKNYPELEI